MRFSRSARARSDMSIISTGTFFFALGDSVEFFTTQFNHIQKTLVGAQGLEPRTPSV
jgi:hypothetical protein